MKNLDVTSAVMQLIFGIACLGLGVYYAVTGAGAQAVIFMLAGAVCLVMAGRTYMKIRRKKKDEEENDGKEE